jgi:hypothetical protein
MTRYDDSGAEIPAVGATVRHYVDGDIGVVLDSTHNPFIPRYAIRVRWSNGDVLYHGADELEVAADSHEYPKETR